MLKAARLYFRRLLSRSGTRSGDRYGVSAEDYLRRARKRLRAGSVDDLFYAAFELRCGIEARMREYLELRDEVAEKRKKEWRINRLGETIEKALKVTDRIAVIKFKQKDGTPIVELRHVPVSRKLREMAERLGDFLHAQRQGAAPSDKRWAEMRSYLAEGCDGLEQACSGTIMEPPLLNRRTGKMTLTIVCNGKEVTDKMFQRLLRMPGTECLADISYEKL